jgi:hypothetical protein
MAQGNEGMELRNLENCTVYIKIKKYILAYLSVIVFTVSYLRSS